jgi:hypothetical protein
MLGPGGSTVILGVGGRDLAVPLAPFKLYQNKSILGCRYGAARAADDIPASSICTYKGDCCSTKMVSAVYPLEDVRRAFRRSRSRQARTRRPHPRQLEVEGLDQSHKPRICVGLSGETARLLYSMASGVSRAAFVAPKARNVRTQKARVPFNLHSAVVDIMRDERVLSAESAGDGAGRPGSFAKSRPCVRA